MKYKVVIVDDEPLALEVLQHYLKDESAFDIVGAFTNPGEALSFLNEHQTDLLFLDINMATLNGLELVRQLKEEPLIVFTTAYREYLQDGFDQGILDYLQKPIKPERVAVTLARARKLLTTTRPQESNTEQKRIYVKSTQKEEAIDVSDICFVRGVKDYCLIVLKDNRKVMALGSLKSFLSKHALEESFIRVHKSFSVPVQQLKEIQSGGVIAIDQFKVPIGRRYKNNVLAVFKKKQG